MTRALTVLALGLYVASCLCHCAGASDLAKYEADQDACVANASSRAEADACRAKVKAAFDASHYSYDGGLLDAPDGGGD